MFRLKYVVAACALALTGLVNIFTPDVAFAASCNSLPQLAVGNCADASAIDIYSPPSPASDTPATSFSSSLPVFNSASAGLSNAFAATSFGVNKASASRGPFATVGAANGDFGAATSTWTDQFVITGGTGAGSVTFGDHISGTNGLGGSWFFVFCQGVFCSGTSNSFPFSASSVSTEVTDTLAFTYGVPFLLSAVLGVDAGHDAGAFVATFVNFSSTAILDELILPNGAILNSESGTLYPLSGTPLPTALPLFAGGLGVIGLLARRRKRKAAAFAA
jgi:hypothetical protein